MPTTREEEYRTVEEYREACKKKPKKQKGNKYYLMGVALAEEAIRQCEERRANMVRNYLQGFVDAKAV